MGMSASQARLLSVTSRMTDIEYKSQQVANTKIRLADESEAVAKAYNTALGKQKYTMTNYTATGAQKIDLTVAEILKSDSMYRLKASNGKMIVSADVKQNYSARMAKWNDWLNGFVDDGNTNTYAHKYSQTNSPAARYQESEYCFVLQALYGIPSWNGAYQRANVEKKDNESLYAPLLRSTNPNYQYTQADIDAQAAIFKQLFEATTQDPIHIEANPSRNIEDHDDYVVNTDALITVDTKYLNDPNWLYEAIESGAFMLVSVATGEEVSVSSEVGLSQETDKSGFAKAEAEYTAATAKIKKKEQILDNDLKALETEHSALKTEFDSVKSLIKDNVDKTFNLFS